MSKVYEFNGAIIKKPDSNAAYIAIPLNVKKEFGKDRVAVHATFDNVPYQGQLVRMGAEGHIISIRKDIREQIGKQPGDMVHVTLQERESAKPDYNTIDEYIARYDSDVRMRMEKLRELIHECSPDITEKILWGMATFVLNGNLVHFSGEKRHLGFHPTPSVIASFAERLTSSGYKYSKGTVQFPYDKPLPYDLLKEMVQFRVREQIK
ncbi:DUF1905 domain-containing protein [Paenibacillus yanchengensis]|uniref:DUF1905 domain-containing protein n=1 Tax=Paenibacillus yanchengensis TaxID=2035833 RepID=A0ABW4YQI7_9BACL